MKILLFLSLILFTACSPREDEPTPQQPKITKADSYGTWKATQTAMYVQYSTSLAWYKETSTRTVTITPTGFSTYKFPQADISGTVLYQQDPAYFDLQYQGENLSMRLVSTIEAEIIRRDGYYNPVQIWKLVKQ